MDNCSYFVLLIGLYFVPWLWVVLTIPSETNTVRENVDLAFSLCIKDVCEHIDTEGNQDLPAIRSTLTRHQGFSEPAGWGKACSWLLHHQWRWKEGWATGKRNRREIRLYLFNDGTSAIVSPFFIAAHLAFHYSYYSYSYCYYCCCWF